MQSNFKQFRSKNCKLNFTGVKKWLFGGRREVKRDSIGLVYKNLARNLKSSEETINNMDLTEPSLGFSCILLYEVLTLKLM